METGGFNFLVATPVTCQRCRHLDAINFAYSYASGILRIRIKENVIGEDSVKRGIHIIHHHCIIIGKRIICIQIREVLFQLFPSVL